MKQVSLVLRRWGQESLYCHIRSNSILHSLGLRERPLSTSGGRCSVGGLHDAKYHSLITWRLFVVAEEWSNTTNEAALGCRVVEHNTYVILWLTWHTWTYRLCSTNNICDAAVCSMFRPQQYSRWPPSLLPPICNSITCLTTDITSHNITFIETEGPWGQITPLSATIVKNNAQWVIKVS